MRKICVFWFRRDLRLNDNKGLYQALNSSYPVLPIFIFDTDILDKLKEKKDARVEFIHQEAIKINKALKKQGTSLLIKKGKPHQVFKNLIEEFNIAEVYANHDYEPYAIERDEKIKNLLKQKGIVFLTSKDQVIFEKDEILNQSQKPYKVYTHYKNKWKEKLSPSDLKSYASEKKSHFYKIKNTPILSLEDLKFKKTNIAKPSSLLQENKLKSYHDTRNYPYIDSTSRIGIHLRFGTVSIREIVKKGIKLNDTWLNELIWREFFMQLLYHFPSVVNEPFNKKFKHISWRYDENDFKKWCEGKTGYPMVDAGMRQLNESGFMHNRVRMVCASFLTKHLLIDWRMGEKYFADKLLDFELASNNGNWQWVAGTGADAQPFFRIFNPTEQQKKFDPEFKYLNSSNKCNF